MPDMNMDDPGGITVLHRVAGLLLALLFGLHGVVGFLGWEVPVMEPGWSLAVHVLLVGASLLSMANRSALRLLQAGLLALPGLYFLLGPTLGVSEQSLAFLFLVTAWTLHLLDGGWKHPEWGLAGLTIAGLAGLGIFAALGRPGAVWLTFLSALLMMALAGQLASALGKAQAAKLALMEAESMRMKSLANLGASLGTFGHDLKNRTASQRMFLDLLVPRLKDDPESLHIARRIGDLIAELEASGRTLSSQVLDPHRSIERFDLGELCGAMSDRIALTYGKQVSLELDPADLVIRSPLGDWLAILENLLRNAGEAGGTGPLGLGVRKHDGQLELTVSNDGPCLAECAVCNETGPCFPGDCGLFKPGKTSKPGGSGLGMISVFEALGRLGGSLRVKSAPGRTAFVARVGLDSLGSSSGASTGGTQNG